ncbi:L-2-amino-thiazoline-4-carboxylic acid hydrolase, partial [Tyzzerella sp. OttesenSCG-928-J15]|nr:L-2-amino-thiazoline-4-carboxylic acid hydrolase [Tyzzerella sp. OttesenSCG-928-J15]
AIVPERVDLEYHGCTLLSTWKGLGLDDVTCRSLCEITMNQDTAIADALGLHFDLKETLADGGECCKCSYYR